MTGFGAAEGPVAGRRLRVEIRTVNHRYFNLSAKLPSDLSVLEVEVRDRLRRDFVRRAMAMTLLFQFDTLGEVIESMPVAAQAASLGDLAELLWGQ